MTRVVERRSLLRKHQVMGVEDRFDEGAVLTWDRLTACQRAGKSSPSASEEGCGWWAVPW